MLSLSVRGILSHTDAELKHLDMVSYPRRPTEALAILLTTPPFSSIPMDSTLAPQHLQPLTAHTAGLFLEGFSVSPVFF